MSPRSDSLTPDEFAARYQRVAASLWCVAAGVLGRRDGAEDVVQDAALVALDRLSQFHRGTDFAAWMARIVRYTALNHRRKQRRAPRPAADELVDCPSPSRRDMPVTATGGLDPDQETFDDDVCAALEQLTAPQRTCLLLKTVRGLEYAEISRLLTMPQGTAMSHVHRARQRLLTALDSDAAGAPPRTAACVRHPQPGGSS